jgi:60 kDa SS-A/Ro ribonucleoprotein
MSVTCAVSTDSETSIADPNDPSMLDGVGFDSAAPQLVSDFARGAL